MTIKTSSIEINPRGNVDYKEWVKQTRIYIWPQGESVLQNLENRRQRPYTTYKKEVIPAVLEKMGMPADTKLRWSQYAGCSCPCSPGFIVDGHSLHDVHVTIEGETNE